MTHRRTKYVKRKMWQSCTTGEVVERVVAVSVTRRSNAAQILNQMALVCHGPLCVNYADARTTCLRIEDNAETSCVKFDKLSGNAT